MNTKMLGGVSNPRACCNRMQTSKTEENMHAY